MRVTHINSYFFSNRLHKELVHKLARAGLKQHAFVPIAKGAPAPKVYVKAVSFSIFQCFSKLDRAIWPLKMWKIWREFERDRKEHPADCHHAHTLFVNGLIAYWAKKKFGTPYVVTIRNTDINHFLKKFSWLFRPIGMKVMREADAVITLSHAYWDYQIKAFYSEKALREVAKKHHTISNGCEDFWFEHQIKREAAEEPLRLIFVGLLGRNKNLSAVLEACELLKRKNIAYEMKVVGSGPLEADFTRQAKGLPIKFLGFIEDRQTLREIYQDSDLLVVPSYTESFGVVYAEAMTQGLPVIYTKGQGFDGFFGDGKVGYAVDPDNADQIAASIIAIRENYAKFAQNVADSALQFKWDHTVNELLNVYKGSATEILKADGREK